MPSNLGKAPPKPESYKPSSYWHWQTLSWLLQSYKWDSYREKRQQQSAERDDSSLLCNKELLSGRLDVLAGCSAALWNRLRSI